MPLTDTHAHIHMKPLKYKVDEVLQRAKENRIERIVTIGTTVADSRDAVAMASKYPQVYAAIGVHPHDAGEFNYKDLGILEKLAEDRKVLAIGEIGLDFYRNLSAKDAQTEVFSAMIDLAVSANLPIIIHSREAAIETAQVLENILEDKEHPILFHCFSGEQSLIDWAIARKNVMFSFAGNVTYPKAVQLHEALAQLSPEQIFIETDCPYLAPVPKRGKENEPSYIVHTAEYVCNAKNISMKKLEEQLEINFQRFFTLHA